MGLMTEPPKETMRGKVVLLTGAASGIGKEAAVKLARAGATVVMTARDRVRGEAVRNEVAGLTGGRVDLLLADLSEMAQVKRLALEFKDRYALLDVLINNAGLWLKKRTFTSEGIETTFAVDYLAPFLLTRMLLDRLQASARARIVNVSSVRHRLATLDLSDLYGEKLADPGKMYGRAKLALVMFTYELARRLRGTRVTANALCPGGVATRIWSRNRDVASRAKSMLAAVLLKTPEQGSRLVHHLAAAPELEGVSAGYFEIPAHFRFVPFNVAETQVRSSPESYDEAKQRALWGKSSALAGLED